MVTTFDSAETLGLLNKAGQNVIKGSALIRQNRGSTVTCAGSTVRLFPATNYSKERIAALYGDQFGGFNKRGLFGKVQFSENPSAYLQATKKTTCDAQGYFTFDNVGDGEWYAMTTITWKTNDYIPEGGNLAKLITVKGGETVNIVLSPRY